MQPDNNKLSEYLFKKRQHASYLQKIINHLHRNFYFARESFDSIWAPHLF